MEHVYLLLGSNEGNRQANIEFALAQIAVEAGPVLVSSSLYETEPWGLKEQASFMNQAVKIETDLGPEDLLGQLKAIEQEMGRKEAGKWGPRLIDIDILFYGQQVIDRPDLKVPHPFIQDRKFTLVPMVEIAPGFVHPVLRKTMLDLLEVCGDKSEVGRVLQ